VSRVLCAAVVLLVSPSLLHADHFDEHTLSILQGIAKQPDAKRTGRLSLTELAGLPKVVQGASQSVLIVVRTDEGNWSKLLVRGGGVRRKGNAQPKPFLHVERLTTYSAEARRGVLADRRDVFLFAGFAIDLDLGQIVVKGDGDDLSFESPPMAPGGTAKGEMMEGGSPRLGPLQGTAALSAGAEWYIPKAPLVAASKASGRTKSTGAITPADYVGKYRLDVDGRFTGVLQLRQEEGKLRGAFVSDQSGASFNASGVVGAPAQQISISISFPRTDLKLEGRLFTRSRSKIAGSATMEENVFGFVAERVD
jgi:hypothetical protein